MTPNLRVTYEKGKPASKSLDSGATFGSLFKNPREMSAYTASQIYLGHRKRVPFVYLVSFKVKVRQR